MSIILGIDPGSRITGYGVIRIVSGKAQYLGSGCIRTDLGELPSRLKRVYDGVSRIITPVQAGRVCHRAGLYGPQRRLGPETRPGPWQRHRCGGQRLLPVSEYSATQIKQAVVGTGGAGRSRCSTW